MFIWIYIYTESEYDYIEGDYIYTDGVYDDYYEDYYGGIYLSISIDNLYSRKISNLMMII